jgi:hypothetical protein
MQTHWTTVASLLLAGLALLAPSSHAQSPQAEKKAEKADLSQALAGAWVHVGEPGNVADPKPGARMKFWGAKHWVITQADPDTGVVIFHHGGTYTLDGDKYVETITFANDNTAHLIKTQLRFTIKVDGDTYTQTGDGNPFTEVWKRLGK